MPSADFFARLDAFDWGSVEHAYGPATDVPKLVRQLTSADEEEREHAFHELYGNVWHQGTVYPASAPAARFIAELLSDESQPARTQILRFLGLIASGTSYHQSHRHFRTAADAAKFPSFSRMSDEEWEAEVDRELGWVREAAAAVADETPTLLRLLEHTDPELREAAAWTLGQIPGALRCDPEVLWRRVMADDSLRVRISTTLALARAVTDGPSRERLLVSMRAEHSPELQLVWALALVRAGASPLPAEVLDVLFDAVGRSSAFQVLEPSVWFDRMPAHDLVTSWLAESPSREAAVCHWIQALPSLPAEPALEVADSLVRLAFRRRDFQRVEFLKRSELEKNALRALLSCDAYWSKDRYAGGRYGPTTLPSFGLPQRREELRCYVAGSEAGPRSIESRTGHGAWFSRIRRKLGLGG